MTTTTETKPWDFSHVLAFTNNFSPAASANAIADAETPPAANRNNASPRTSTDVTGNTDTIDYGATTDPAVLGNFSKVWQFLGVPNPPPTSSTPRTEQAPDLAYIKDDYASDGAAYKSKASDATRGLQWTDGTDEEGSGSATSAAAQMTKSQRKKARRRERKAALASLPAQGFVSESEADHIAKRTPARKASAHTMRSATPTTTQVHNRDLPRAMQEMQLAETPSKIPGHAVSAIGYSTKDGPSATRRTHYSTAPNDENARRAVEAVAKATAAMQGQNNTPTPPPRYNLRSHAAKQNQAEQNTATSAQQRPALINGSSIALRAMNYIPGSVMLPPAPSTPKQLSRVAAATPNTAVPRTNVVWNNGVPSMVPGLNNAIAVQPVVSPSMSAQRAKPTNVIEPHVVRSGDDRNWALFMKIVGDFYEDRKHLAAPMNLTTHNNHPQGIHVFVDASNIFIGFMDQLKRARGMHPRWHVPQANLSFDGLALLMERRRPVARRVLAGSTPHIPAFDKAKAVGYECLIMEKVFKARELTERQIYFRELDARRSGKPTRFTPGKPTTVANSSPASFTGIGFGSGSGSETNTPQYDPPKYVEQGVDEILHLKILESVVDAERPSTIVLATGDAAAAEYSLGFMAMLERALNKGWNVELVSWSKNISALYTQQRWRDAWGDRFRIIFLDDYAEELLDM